MNHFHIDKATKSLKTILENNRCVNCDQLNVPCIRYPCGHLTCNNCVATAEDCLLCLTPPVVSTHFIDEPSSLRVKHASDLLTAFQELFEIDVYRRHRISEKLKVEKELFPECIQASSTYFNKRKSLNSKLSKKENKRFASLPGENISLNKPFKMENIMNNVEHWMNKNESLQNNSNNLPRKPFTDLNVNIQKNKDAKNLVIQTRNKESISRKRTNFKVSNDTSNVPRKKFKKPSKEYVQNSNKMNKIIKSENNESGIFIDDETIVIDDSQYEGLDKDRLALLAVLEADKKDHSIDCGVELSNNEIDLKTRDNFDQPNKSQDVTLQYKVPFLKKSILVDVCKLCKEASYVKKAIQTTKNISLTIDSESFITTIKVSDCSERVICSKKQSTAAQTDCVGETENIAEKIENNTSHNSLPEDKIDTGVKCDNEVKITKMNNMFGNKSKCIVIEESDTDSELSFGEENFEVTAEAHQSESIIGRGVLGELERNDFEHRGKHAVREHSPLSTDSSDKENYDPNRMKKQNAKKKCCFKNKY